MVGFGSNYPTHVRSRVASCPDTGSCGDTYLNSTSDNIYEMTGAVVGGPNEAGEYEDSRLNILGNGGWATYKRKYLTKEQFHEYIDNDGPEPGMSDSLIAIYACSTSYR